MHITNNTNEAFAWAFTYVTLSGWNRSQLSGAERYQTSTGLLFFMIWYGGRRCFFSLGALINDFRVYKVSYLSGNDIFSLQ